MQHRQISFLKNRIDFTGTEWKLYLAAGYTLPYSYPLPRAYHSSPRQPWWSSQHPTDSLLILLFQAILQQFIRFLSTDSRIMPKSPVQLHSTFFLYRYFLSAFNFHFVSVIRQYPRDRMAALIRRYNKFQISSRIYSSKIKQIGRRKRNKRSKTYKPTYIDISSIGLRVEREQTTFYAD